MTRPHATRPSSRSKYPLPGLVLVTALATGVAPAQESRRHPEGVTATIEARIQRGLGYLVRSQQRDGSWDPTTGRGNYPVAMTALCGMALLGSGSTPTRGKRWRSVRKAAGFLLKSVRSDGLITAPGEGRSMYGHGFATLFLSQVYGMEEATRRQRELHRVLSRACTLICRSQSAEGGWYYWPESRREEGSVAITQIQALRACRDAGISVPKQTIDRAVRYVHKLANADGSIAYSIHSRNGYPGISAAAAAVLHNAARHEDKVGTRALDFAFRHLPVHGAGNGHHYYGHYYLAQSLYQRNDKRWPGYYRRMAGWLMRQQSRDGSWMGDGISRTYGTALACTILQLPHALVPIYQR